MEYTLNYQDTEVKVDLTPEEKAAYDEAQVTVMGKLTPSVIKLFGEAKTKIDEVYKNKGAQDKLKLLKVELDKLPLSGPAKMTGLGFNLKDVNAYRKQLMKDAKTSSASTNMVLQFKGEPVMVKAGPSGTGKREVTPEFGLKLSGRYDEEAKKMVFRKDKTNTIKFVTPKKAELEGKGFKALVKAYNDQKSNKEKNVFLKSILTEVGQEWVEKNDIQLQNFVISVLKDTKFTIMPEVFKRTA